MATRHGPRPEARCPCEPSPAEPAIQACLEHEIEDIAGEVGLLRGCRGALSLAPNPDGHGRMGRRVVPDFYIAGQPWWSPDIGGSAGCGAGQRVGWGGPPPEAWWLAGLPCGAPSLDAIHRGGALAVSDGSMSGDSRHGAGGRWRGGVFHPPAPGQERILAGIKVNDWVGMRPAPRSHRSGQ
jgi:hypothetical protein